MNRRGYTLIEMATIMPLGGILLTLAIGLIHSSMRLGSVVRERTRVAIVTDHLVRQFRADVHGAETATIEGSTLRLVIPAEPMVTYRWDGETEPLTRERAANEPSGTPRRESFRLPIDTRIGWSVDDDKTELTLHRVGPDGRDIVRRRVVAELGRRRRLVTEIKR